VVATRNVILVMEGSLENAMNIARRKDGAEIARGMAMAI
jgi:hypothetical protein